jgi:hypothetical protein
VAPIWVPAAPSGALYRAGFEGARRMNKERHVCARPETVRRPDRGGEIDDRTRWLHFLSFIARSTSRLASRVLMVSRRSCNFLPLANPSSTLARPRLEK